MADEGTPGLALRTLGNSMWGMAGFVLPLIISLFLSPFMVHRLGADLFGVLAIVGVTLGSFGFLDFGIGGAATRQIAAYHSRAEHESVNKVVNSVLAFYLVVGAGVAVFLLVFANLMVTTVLHVPPEFSRVAKISFYLAAPSFITSLVSGALLSIPGALQRYGIATKFGLSMAALNGAMTFGLLSAGYGIVAVMVSGLVIAICGLPIEYAIARRLLPSFRLRPRWDGAMLKELFSFGGYFLLASVGVLLLYQADKLLVSYFLGVAAVTYYVVPGGLAQKIQGVVGASTGILFPLSAALFESSRHDTLVHLYREGTRLVFAFVALMAVPLGVFSDKFLLFWMGPDIARHSSAALALLVGTYAFLAISGVPWGIANGSGRSKINAIFTLGIAAIDLSAFLLLVRPFGVTGAAAAYLISAVVGVPVLIWYIERHVLGLSGFEYVRIFWRIGLVALVQGAIAFLARPLCASLISTGLLMVASACSFVFLYWAFGFVRDGDRRLISLVVTRFRG